MFSKPENTPVLQKYWMSQIKSILIFSNFEIYVPAILHKMKLKTKERESLNF